MLWKSHGRENMRPFWQPGSWLSVFFSAPKKAERILRGNGARSQNLRELVLSDVLPPKGSGIFPSSTTNGEPRVHICEPAGIFSHLNSMCYPSIY